MNTTRKIMLIEDNPSGGKVFKIFLEALGHTVDWFIGAKSIEPSLQLATITGEFANINFDDYEIALVDGDLGSSIQGWDITRFLVAGGVPVIGISADDIYNAKIKEAGAREAFFKTTIPGKINSGQINLTRTVAA